MKPQKNGLKFWLLVFILLVAVLTRSYKINNSMTEWFAWRQSDTLAVGRFLARDNFNLLRPRYYDLSNVQSGYDNPQGLRFVEFPLYNAMFGWLEKTMPIVSLEVWARIVTIIFSLIIIVCLYLLLASEFGLTEAFFAGLYFAVSPYIVFYSRAVLPDMPAASLATLSVYLVYRFYKSGNYWSYLLGLLFFALALLIKPMVLFFSIPIAYLFWRREESWLFKGLKALIFLGLSVVPLLWWRSYIKAFPEGVPYNQWLFTSVNTINGMQNIFFRPAFFRWIFFERLNNLLLGGYLTFFFLFGLLGETKKNIHLHWVFLISSLAYLFTFQGGNVQHDYYQIIITPTIALLIGVGVGGFLRNRKHGYLIIKTSIVFVIFAVSFLFSWFQIKGNYTEQQDLVLMSEVIKSLTSSKDIIVTDTMGDTTLLYLSDRRGYPHTDRSFEALKEKGAKYFVTRNSSYKETLTDYKLIFENKQFLLFEL